MTLTTRKGQTALSFTVTNSIPYAKWVNDGTGIYGPRLRPIVPKKKTTKALHWQVGGGSFFAASVKGQKGQKYVEKAIEKLTFAHPSATFTRVG